MSTADPQPHTLRFGGDAAPLCSWQEARAVILPLPYEKTVSYGKGTSQGPQAILQASAQLELYDEELDCQPCEAGLFTLTPLSVKNVLPEDLPQKVCQVAADILQAGKLLCCLGGEHTVSLGAFQACHQVLQKPFSILQLDAHADLRPSYQANPYSHACIMARVHELGIPFVQAGIRSISAAERAFVREHQLEERVFWAQQLCSVEGHQKQFRSLIELLEPQVYITLDVDVLDPACMPATGTPEPGGLDWFCLLELLREISRRRRIVAIDVVELAPIPKLHAANFTAAKLVYKMLAYALQSRQQFSITRKP